MSNRNAKKWRRRSEAAARVLEQALNREEALIQDAHVAFLNGCEIGREKAFDDVTAVVEAVVHENIDTPIADVIKDLLNRIAQER